MSKEQFIRVNENGTKLYYSDREMKILHREDGPAVECANGNKWWFLNGKVHRENAPAVIRANGDKEWFLHGKRHRDVSPAVEYADGVKSWWVNGKKITELS
jgi:hypothetical protein